MNEVYSFQRNLKCWQQRKLKTRNKIPTSWKPVKSIQDLVRLMRAIQLKNPMEYALKYFRVNGRVKSITSCNLCNGVFQAEKSYVWILFPSTLIFTTVKIFQPKKKMLKGKFVSRKTNCCINWNSLICPCWKMKIENNSYQIGAKNKMTFLRH